MKKPKKDLTYADICDRCGKEFIFKESQVRDRVIICPHCNHSQIFIKSNYK